mgnify:CR=1 FL=1|tara:strand:+ start:952 stop:2046 length:1095 start_codon:yes stop_codon:yes gene_type:complete
MATLSPSEFLKAPTKKKASKGKVSVLRYPYDIISASTDYFQIDVMNYKATGGTNPFKAKSRIKKFIGPYSMDTYKKKGLTESSATVDENGIAQFVDGELDQMSVKMLSDQYLNGRADKSIILPIPSDIQDSNGVKWGEDELNDFAAWGMTQMGEVIDTDTMDEAARVATNTIGQIARASKGTGGRNLIDYFKTTAVVTAANAMGANTSVDGVLARSSGQIINKNVELLFSGVQLRTFNFSFDISPRDETEADMVKQIIFELKKRMSPKMNRDQMGFLNSPDVFRIAYKKGRDEHPFLNSFKTCALTQMNVNYTGSGTYSTYHNGVPVHLNMSLSFKELNPIYAEDYEPSESNGFKGKKPSGVGY